MGMIHRRFIAKNKQANKLRKEPNALKPIARDQSNDVIICRCEKIIDGDSYGPFTASVYDTSLTKAVNYYKDQMPAMPEPSDEGLRMYHGLRVGMEIKDFGTWFPSRQAGELLTQAGFIFNIYTIHPSKVQCGKSQVVFHLDNATKLATMDFKSMLGFYNAWIMKKGNVA
jgi:hypothetical protein